MPQEQGKPEVYIITHGNLDIGKLESLLANLEKNTFEDLPINKPLDIGELAKIASKQNRDSWSKSTKDVIESLIEQEIGTDKKAIVMIDEVPAQSISQQHSSIKNEWQDMKKEFFKGSGLVPLAFDLCYLAKYKNIQFVIIMTPSKDKLPVAVLAASMPNSQYFPEVFEFPQSEYGERKIIEVDGSYHYSELAPGILNNIIPQSKVDQCLLSKVQFYHHLPARYRNCADILNFIKFVAKNEHMVENKLNDSKDKSVDLSKLPPSYSLPAGLKPVIWIQALEKSDFKEF